MDQEPNNGKCLNCGSATKYKNKTYRKFCSVLCLNRYKARQPEFIKKLSESQKGIPRRSHTKESKHKLSVKSVAHWSKNRGKMLDIFRDPAYRKKQSYNAANAKHKHTRYIINNIRCDSLAEKKFIEYCYRNNFLVRRFGSMEKEKSIHISDNKWSVPDFVCSELLVEVKDFHPWFKQELYNGMKKYIDIDQWCRNHEYFFIFWFPKIGWIHLEQLMYIKNDQDLNYFLEKYDNNRTQG